MRLPPELDAALLFAVACSPLTTRHSPLPSRGEHPTRDLLLPFVSRCSGGFIPPAFPALPFRRGEPLGRPRLPVCPDERGAVAGDAPGRRSRALSVTQVLSLTSDGLDERNVQEDTIK